MIFINLNFLELKDICCPGELVHTPLKMNQSKCENIQGCRPRGDTRRRTEMYQTGTRWRDLPFCGGSVNLSCLLLCIL